MIRATAVILKWGLITTLLLAGGYFGVRYLMPIIEEIQHPGKKDVLKDKNASTAVRVIQQTRQVVKTSDKKVDYLNDVIEAYEGKSPAAPVSKEKKAAPEAAPKKRVLVNRADVEVFITAVTKFKMSGVFDGPEPRIYLNDRLVKYGEIVDRDLGLRFMGVDQKIHAALFSNADNIIFRKYY
jgi:hypothetical protein